MIRIPIGGEPRQALTVENNDIEFDMSIRFLPVAEQWIASVTYLDRAINGVKFAVGTLHMNSQGYPFDFVVVDESGNGIDPYRLNDFADGRCSLFMVEPDEIEELRGYPVEIL